MSEKRKPATSPKSSHSILDRDENRHPPGAPEPTTAHAVAEREISVKLEPGAKRVLKLQHRVYRDIPVATWNRVLDVDFTRSYQRLRAPFAGLQNGVLSGGAALALWRAAADRNLRAWCFDFGFPNCFTHMVTIIEAKGRLHVCDSFLDIAYGVGFHELLEALGAGATGPAFAASDQRKIYLADPAFESETAMRWLEANASRELPAGDGLRKFEVRWDLSALATTHPGVERAIRKLASLGLPPDFQFLMLQPIRVFDGKQWLAEPDQMPLIREHRINGVAAPRRLRVIEPMDKSMPAKAIQAKSMQDGRIAELEQTGRARLETELAASRELVDQTRHRAIQPETDDNLAAIQYRELAASLDEKVTLLARQDDALAARLDEVSNALAGHDHDLAVKLDETAAALAARLDTASNALAGQDHALAVKLDETGTALAARLDAASRALAGQDHALAVKVEEIGSALAARLERLEATSTELQRTLELAIAGEVRIENSRAALDQKTSALTTRSQELEKRVDEAVLGWEGGRQALEVSFFSIRREVAEIRQTVLEADRRHTRQVAADMAQIRDQLQRLVTQSSEVIAQSMSVVRRELPLQDIREDNLVEGLELMRRKLRLTERELDRSDARLERLCPDTVTKAGSERPLWWRLIAFLAAQPLRKFAR